MTTHRRTTTIPLYPGEYEQSLAEALDHAQDVIRREATSGRLRFGQRSPAIEAAEAFDRLRDSPPDPIAEVTLWQVGYLDWDDLVAQHPARADNQTDVLNDVNMATFPRALLHLSMVNPDDTSDMSQRLVAGEQALREVNPSRVHYRKLEEAAWAVNNEALNLPKESLASLLTQPRGDDSGQPTAQA